MKEAKANLMTPSTILCCPVKHKDQILICFVKRVFRKGNCCLGFGYFVKGEDSSRENTP